MDAGPAVPSAGYASGFSVGMGNGMAQLPIALGAGEEWEREVDRRKKEQKLEWRKRWVVIYNGWVYLFKQRNVSISFLLFPSFCPPDSDLLFLFILSLPTFLFFSILGCGFYFLRPR